MNTTENIPVMTVRKNANDYVENVDNTTKVISGNYRFFEDGGKIIIRDTIRESIYGQTSGINYVEFKSFPGYPKLFDGNISYKFQSGNKVDLTVHILRISFFEIIDNETWTVELEPFTEVGTPRVIILLHSSKIFNQNKY